MNEFPIKRLYRIIRDTEDMIAVVEWWNRNRLDAPPLDCEPERILLKLARECYAAFLSNDYEKYSEISSRMADYAEGLQDES